MAIDEEIAVCYVETISKPIELKNIGYLKKEPTYVNCPACEGFAMSTVRLEHVTYLQRFLRLTKLCNNWESRSDINHYCTNCGCFIGRFVAIGCGERYLSRSARRKAAIGGMSLKTKPKDCAANIQKIRDHVKSEQAKEKARKDARQLAEAITSFNGQ